MIEVYYKFQQTVGHLEIVFHPYTLSQKNITFLKKHSKPTHMWRLLGYT